MAATTKTKTARKPLEAHVAKKRVLGSIVIERFLEQFLPASMKKPLADFKSAHAALKNVAQKTEDTFLELSEAEKTITTANAALNLQVQALANALVGAGLATRTQPFAGYSKLAPSKLVKLPVATKVKETRTISKKVGAKKANAAVNAAAKTLSAKADAAAAALGMVSGPALRTRNARAAVDAAIAPWAKAYDHLKKYAAVAWIDAPETYKSLFAPPERVQAPKATRAKKKAGATAAATKPPTTPEAPPT